MYPNDQVAIVSMICPEVQVQDGGRTWQTNKETQTNKQTDNNNKWFWWQLPVVHAEELELVGLCCTGQMERKPDHRKLKKKYGIVLPILTYIL